MFSSAEFSRTVIIARFKTSKEARECQRAINAIFEQIQAKVDNLFETQNGEAHISDIAQIFAGFGFTNEVGWEQDIPLVSNGCDVAWALPSGAKLLDAENLVMTMNPQEIESHEQSQHMEEWQLHPHPAIMPLVPEDFHEDDDDFADDYYGAEFKRLLH